MKSDKEADMTHERLCLALRVVGLPWCMREIVARHKVTIVNYHDPSPDIFARHMALFARSYNFISIAQLVTALTARDFSQFPPKAMLITLDDGHIGNARLFATLREYTIPAVLYAVAGVVDTNRGFWFERLDHSSAAMERLKKLADGQRRNELERDYGHTDEREYDKPSALTADQLREFIALGGTVGSHTLFHPLLDRCDPATGNRETSLSRTILEKLLSIPIHHFALPNGNGDANSRQWVQQAGYRTCRTTKPGWVETTTDPLALPNFGIADNAGPSKALVQASGLWYVAKKLFGRVKQDG